MNRRGQRRWIGNDRVCTGQERGGCGGSLADREQRTDVSGHGASGFIKSIENAGHGAMIGGGGLLMVVTTHQPIFLPWPGFFYKALHADAMVLLDRVQFPQGRSWMHRNRVKSVQGDHWLRVPLRRTGRGKQMIADVEISEDSDWRTKHLRSVRELYAHAPYLQPHLTALDEIYGRRHGTLAALNIDLIRHLWLALRMAGKLHLQSELDVAGQGPDLLANVCEALKADTYLALTVAAKYMNREALAARGIELALVKFRPPVYPQLWGDFRYNVSTLDLLLNCGPKAREIIAAS